MNEHLTCEVFRRAGLAAPATVRAVVTINGKLNGICLMREPTNQKFIERNFGSAFAGATGTRSRASGGRRCGTSRCRWPASLR